MASQVESSNTVDEKPPSPIISRKFTGKYLTRKLQRKSRVQLSKRFGENQAKPSSSSSHTESYSHVLCPENVSDDNKAEDKESEDVQCKLTSCNEHERSVFAVTTSETLKIHPYKLKIESLNSIGFKTAGGKSLVPSDETLKLSKQLFEDILSPSNDQVGTTRSKKYRFLSKRKEASQDSSRPCKKINSGHNSEKDVASFGFKVRDSGCGKLCEGPQNSKASIEELTVLESDVEFLSTQETDQLLADFTVIESDLNTATESSENFKGFPSEDIKKSQLKVDEFLSFFQEVTIENTLCPSFIKLPLEDISNNTLKSIASNLSTKNLENVDFQTTSGNSIKLPENALPQSRQFFSSPDNEFSIKFPSTLNENAICFKTASGNSLKVSGSVLKKAKNLFQDIDKDLILGEMSGTSFKNLSENKLSEKALRVDEVPIDNKLEPDIIAGFQTASGNSLKVSESILKKATNLFQDIDKDLILGEMSGTSFKNPSENNLSEKTLRDNVDSIDNKLETKVTAGFQTASGNVLKFSNDSLKKTRNIFQDFDDLLSDNAEINKDSKNSVSNSAAERSSSSFQTASGNALHLPEDALNEAADIFQNIDVFLENIDDKTSPSRQRLSESSNKLLDDTVQNTSKTIKNSSLEDNTLNLSSNTKTSGRKRLGVSFCKQIPISKQKLENAKKIFTDDKITMSSPIRTKSPTVYSSTPLKDSNLVKLEPDITPIKPTGTSRDFKENVPDERFVITDCTKGNVDTWNKLLQEEKQILERKLKILEEKQRALDFQKHLITDNVPQRRISGVLFEAKKVARRIPLKDFIEIDSSGSISVNINPQNAELLHFKTSRNTAFLKTLDGATLVPNINHQIGLSEIQVAFELTPGVDPKLISDFWISNHFRWIVWKLASYENFSKNLKSCLNVENVMQQLKYRYDREIDRAERSALRKIFELDDVPQKRMVLCVSNIFKLEKIFELELTDGWYCIRTTIDEVLSEQVNKGRIKIGCKLVTCGAEILNCEGCHPLDATNLIRLKISYNSTRRAKWWSKLGYQNCPEPFPLKLSSVSSKGGVIGCVKLLVARVYPLKFLEKQNNLSVWRNRKAEELRAQEWQNQRRQEIEKIRETIRRDYEMNLRKTKRNLNPNISNQEIRKVTCPETLFRLYENSNDPEKFQEFLTSSQKHLIKEYQEQIVFQQQQELSRKFQENMNNLKIPERDVAAVFQFLVVDVLDENEKTSIFQIWRPTDSHLEMIKESSVYFVYNVAAKNNGDLRSTKRTKFQQVEEDTTKYYKYKRKLLPISEIINLHSNPLLNEFDTVGLVVSVSVESCSQNLWLSDVAGRLLFIKIFEAPTNCLLLDKVKIGQVVSVSNLIYCKSKLDFGEAIANHLTVITSYPQQKYLQEGIYAFNEELPKDRNSFLEQCNQKIAVHTERVDIKKNYRNNSNSLTRSNPLASSDIFDDSSNYLYSMLKID